MRFVSSKPDVRASPVMDLCRPHAYCLCAEVPSGRADDARLRSKRPLGGALALAMSSGCLEV